MLLTRVSLSNVRNYARLDFEPAPGLNVFVGDNAQGKSNLLEAISMLGTGKSFRTNREADLVKTGLEIATISGEARIAAGNIRLACTITATSRGTRKLYAINGEAVRYARFLGSVKVVTFVPGDLHLVTGPPAMRRSMLNVALAQDQRSYYHELVRYQKAVAQKSALLRGIVPPDPSLLEIYNQTLVEAGSKIMLARAHLVAALERAAQHAHAGWTGGAERFGLQYVPNVPFDVPTDEAVAGAFETRLRERADAEAARKAVLVGPHRDDVALTLDGASLAAYGSQGQQRTAVLALKVGEYAVMHERSGEAPLLLLDDVLSELDPSRAGAFFAGIGGYEQAFLTTTTLPASAAGAAAYRIADAALQRIA
ncbi:MAG: DNA replication/repair protein RecF [Candidatus Eremiobacteraeota bacterium]|nr:DNA replication/repair protein RecF [Candidatus Eremiobacteraeota bacterium]